MNSSSMSTRHSGVGWWVKLGAITGFIAAATGLIAAVSSLGEASPKDAPSSDLGDHPNVTDQQYKTDGTADTAPAEHSDSQIDTKPLDGASSPPPGTGTTDAKDRTIWVVPPDDRTEDGANIIEEEESADETMPELDAQASIHVTPGFYRIERAGGINLREGPSLEAPPLAQLAPGQIYVSTGEVEPDGERYWIEIAAPEHGLGWASTRYLERVPDEQDDLSRPGPFRVTGAVELNIREEPQIDASAVLTLPAGTIVYSTGKSENDGEREWLQVLSSGGEKGWASLNYLARTGAGGESG
jgi:hypothetical protein